VNAAGARTFLHCLGVSGEILITPEEIAEAARGRAHYHLGAPFRLARMRGRQHHLLCAARAAGLKTSLDTQWDPDGKWMEEIGPCLPWADYFFANEDEFRMLAATDQPAEAARFLQRHGAAVVVLKLGARGCAVYTGTEEILCPALEVTVVDTTGAGDCFVGAFLDCVTRGVALREAARFACEIAACSIQRLGATEGVPSRGT
jgi:sugar/nucleoside kinase (ribokinase family)